MVRGIIIKRAPLRSSPRIWTPAEILGASLIWTAAILWAASGVIAGAQAVARWL